MGGLLQPVAGAITVPARPAFAAAPGVAGASFTGGETLAEIFHLITGFTPSLARPYLVPSPFALTWLGPHAFGGFLPNEWFGVPPDLGLTDTLGVVTPGGAVGYGLAWLQDYAAKKQQGKDAVLDLLRQAATDRLEKDRARLLDPRNRTTTADDQLLTLTDQVLQERRAMTPVIDAPATPTPSPAPLPPPVPPPGVMGEGELKNNSDPADPNRPGRILVNRFIDP